MVPVDLNIIAGYLFVIPCLIHSWKKRGLFKSLLFLFGSILVTGAVENAAIIFGGYYYPGAALTVWYYRCPLDVCIGWYYLAYSSVTVAGMLLKKSGFVARALLGSFLAVNLDFFLDPVAVANGWWVWSIKNIYVLGVPLGNWFGWFMLVFLFAMMFEVVTNKTAQYGKAKTIAVFAAGCIGVALATLLILATFNLSLINGGLTNGGNIVPPRGIDEKAAYEITWVLVFTAFMVVILALTYFAPDKTAEVPKKIDVLPPATLLAFWAMIMVMAALTAPFFVLLGLSVDVPFLGVNVYVIRGEIR
jgi:uncharacterized membrane protein